MEEDLARKTQLYINTSILILTHGFWLSRNCEKFTQATYLLKLNVAQMQDG